jgi:predicted ATPase/DNA-binding winged helix-turn-helix (wHTH) protein
MENSDRVLTFGRFRLFPASRSLLADGAEVPIGSRQFDILLALIERRERVVSRNELMQLAWPGVVVAENSLTVQVAQLRKQLGHGIIATVAGRGYRFIAPVEGPASDAPQSPSPDRAIGALPRPISRFVGRSEEIQSVVAGFDKARLVTLVGPGGIGKTRVALAAAEQVRGRFPDGASLVDLASASGPLAVERTIAAALDLELRGSDTLRELCHRLAAMRALLVLDSCEHLLGAVALVAEAVLRSCPNVALLATSREPLHAEGESAYRLAPLPVAPADQPATVADLRSYAAVELFLDRASAADAGFAPTDDQAVVIIDICRRLDGIPLAIELAAARLGSIGVEELARLLEDRLAFLKGGRRAALPRHQTLRATLDWSYHSLPEIEALVLRRVSRFVGSFALDAAEAVAAAGGLVAGEVFDVVANLVAKSLVSMASTGASVRYRLLDTTRAYALEKLADSGEAAATARRHAVFYCDLLARARQAFPTRTTDEWLATYRLEVDNIRAAIDWAFSDDGDPAIGVSLSAATAGLLVDLGLLEAAVRDAGRALAAIAAGLRHNRSDEMRLQVALGAAIVYTSGPAEATATATWERALEIARSLGDTSIEARAIWGLWNAKLYGGAPGAAMVWARQFNALVSTLDHPQWTPLGSRALGITHHYRGEQAEARRCLEHMLAHYRPAVHHWLLTVGFRVNMAIVGRANLARTLWVLGLQQQALATLRDALAEAQAYGHALTLQYVLIETAMPLALLVGDNDAAQRAGAQLLKPGTTRGLFIFESCARCFEAIRLARSGEIGRGLSLLRAALAELRETGFAAPLTFILGMLAECLVAAGDLVEAAAVVAEGLARCETLEDGWFAPELLRTKGQIAIAEGAPAVAETQFEAAVALARRQDALSWELRATTQLATLRRRMGRGLEGRAVLEPVYQKFCEGFDLPDLTAAKAALDACAG